MGSLVELARKLRPYIEKAAQSLSDADALEAVSLYPEWAAEVWYEADFKVRYGNRLYRVVQSHTSQAGWSPDSVPALFAEINETHDGTLDNPIPYNGNMALESGKYYIQNGAVYRCTRDTGIPVYHALSALVGLYVEVVNV